MTKLSFIGGGGKVSTTAAAQFARFPEAGDLELNLYDVDVAAARQSREMILRGAELEGADLKVVVSPSLRAALADADVVLYCAAAPASTRPPFNLTTDLGNVEAMIAVVEKARVLARPDFHVINYANPTDFLGMVLATRYPDLPISSLCTGGEEFKRTLMMWLEIPLEEEARLVVRHVGGNHYGFVLRLELDGEDYLPVVRARPLAWREFKGLRHGDAYDLARNLSLFRASGILTFPLGHVPYFHGDTNNPGFPRDRGHFRPSKPVMYYECTAPDVERALYWELMDSWGTRQVAVATLNLLGRLQRPFYMQAPNAGFLPDLDARAFVEAWGTYEDGRFQRFPVEIPPLVQHLVKHYAWANLLRAEAIAQQDYEKYCRALLLHQVTNFHKSVPAARMEVCDKWGVSDDLDDLYTRRYFDLHEEG